MKKKQSKDTVNDDIVKVFNKFPSEGKYKLTKIKSTRPYSEVNVGNFTTGSFRLMELLGKPAVFVDNSAKEGYRYDDPVFIRTSPVVAILDNSKTKITFQTEGGVYELEKLKESKNERF